MLPLIGREPAVVVGAGIAGLLAARVLAAHHPEVIVVDRDRLPDRPQRRAGVPQSSHVHALFAKGVETIDALLPGFSDEVCRRGGHRIDACNDLAVATPHGWGTRFHSGLGAVSASRPLIEAVIRERVLALPRVRLLQEHTVDSLVGTPRHVTAVTLRHRTTGRGFDLPTGLVVDATGRGSRLPAWLEELGCPPVPETVVDAHLRYATRVYQLDGDAEPRGWRACYSLPFGPAITRGGVLAPLEGDRWIATLSGVGNDQPSSRAEDFLPFARTLTTPLIATTLADAHPLTPVLCSGSTANRRRRLGDVTELPDNLVGVGDSVCALNPVYAQGMTLAALSARLLDSWLESGLPPRHFHRRLQQLHEVPWIMATVADRRFPDTDGPATPFHHRLMGRYLDRVLAAGTRHPTAQHAFMGLLNLSHGPASLLSPGVALRVAMPSLLPRSWSMAAAPAERTVSPSR
ncbi:hypothetical protein GCM10027294_38130 [Marinactinospora endophytica]|nr:FAD-dependent oxidoreductase [Marinactinospora thermotolerans]